MKVFLLFFLMLFGLFATQTSAAVFTVNVTFDQPDNAPGDGVCSTNGGGCSLRAAVQEANALAGSDVINFNLATPATITLDAALGEIAVTNNNGSLRINGLGANVLTIDGGAGTNRIFFIDSTFLAVSNVTLTGGNGTGDSRGNNNGGAIFCFRGALVLFQVHLTGNSSSGSGGAIYFQVLPGASLFDVRNSTIADNTAASCGGFNSGLGTTIVNSTISGNTANTYGGGFCSFADTTIRNVTITDNTAGTAGGGFSAEYRTNFANTIVAGNIAPNQPEIFLTLGSSQNPYQSGGNNFVGNSAGDSSDTNTPIVYQTSDIRDTPPILGELQNNGGQTSTHALRAGSPAIDAGNNAMTANLTIDQRGFTRIVDGNGDGAATVDIGAFEAQVPSNLVNVSGRVLKPKGRGGVPRATVTMTDQNNQTRTAKTDALGYFTFIDVRRVETYTFSVDSPRYLFDSRVVTITDSLNNLNFTARTIGGFTEILKPGKSENVLNFTSFPKRQALFRAPGR